MKKKSFVYPILYMSLITAVFTFVLAFLNYSTADKIEFLQNTELQEKILYVFDMPISSEDPEDISRVFNENIKKEVDGKDIIYYIEDNGEAKAYAFPVGGSGLWGSIEGYVAISSDYERILGLEFISHSETPGLGGRISEEEYKGQFRDLELASENGDYIIYRPASGGNVDAITGATLTSKSVLNFLNKDIERFIKDRKGGE